MSKVMESLFMSLCILTLALAESSLVIGAAWLIQMYPVYGVPALVFVWMGLAWLIHTHYELIHSL